MIYLGTFIISTLFSFVSYNNNEIFINNTKKKRILFSFLAVFSVSLLAGLRSENIGTDVLVYGNTVFYNMTNSTGLISYYFDAIDIFRLEPFYLFINYVVSRFTNTYWIFYFILSFIINSCFYMAAYVLKNKIYPSLSWLIYLLFFYSYTLNIMRQSLATGLMILAISLMIENKIKFAIPFLLLSLLSHYSTGVVAVGLFFVFFLFKKSKNPLKTFGILLMVSLLIVIGIQPISRLLLNINILPQRYSIYFTGERGAGFSLNALILKLPLIFYSVKKINKIKSNDYIFFFFLLMLIFDFLFYQLRIINIVFSRLSFYFGVFQIFSFPYLIKNYVTTVSERKYATIIYISFLTFIWCYQIIYSGVNEIYPYSSIISW